MNTYLLYFVHLETSFQVLCIMEDKLLQHFSEILKFHHCFPNFSGIIPLKQQKKKHLFFFVTSSKQQINCKQIAYPQTPYFQGSIRSVFKNIISFCSKTSHPICCLGHICRFYQYLLLSSQTGIWLKTSLGFLKTLKTLPIISKNSFQSCIWLSLMKQVQRHLYKHTMQ